MVMMSSAFLMEFVKEFPLIVMRLTLIADRVRSSVVEVRVEEATTWRKSASAKRRGWTGRRRRTSGWRPRWRRSSGGRSG